MNPKPNRTSQSQSDKIVEPFKLKTLIKANNLLRYKTNYAPNPKPNKPSQSNKMTLGCG